MKSGYAGEDTLICDNRIPAHKWGSSVRSASPVRPACPPVLPVSCGCNRHIQMPTCEPKTRHNESATHLASHVVDTPVKHGGFRLPSLCLDEFCQVSIAFVYIDIQQRFLRGVCAAISFTALSRSAKRARKSGSCCRRRGPLQVLVDAANY